MDTEQCEAMSLLPLETPPLKVSRPVAACSRCRNAKIKCDGKLPACTSCEKNGRAAECTSTNDQFARGKERSYVSTLETRIDRLEAKIREAQARKPSVVSVPDETPVPSRRPSEQARPSHRLPPNKDQVPTPTTGRRQKRREASAIDELVSDFGFLSVNATARDFHGFTQSMSYARLILWSCSKDELPKGNSKALPSYADGVTLMQFYLNNVFTLLPAFEEAQLWTAAENVYSKGTRVCTSLEYWTIRMIFAIANASMSRRSGDEHHLESISHVCAALDHSEYVLHPGNISGIQALLLLAQYAMLSPHHFDSWQLIGAASRAMTDLGYHQDPPRGTFMDRNRLDLRRKVFYCVYALDRSMSLVQTRAFSFSDASVNVKVPFTKHSANTPIPTETATSSPPQDWTPSYDQACDLMRLRILQSNWYTELFQTSREPYEEPYHELWKACESMRKWFEELSPSTPAHMRQFFELDLLYSYVYVLSPSSRVPRTHQYAQKLIFEHCIRYTDLMLHVIGDSAYTAPLTFYDAMRVYMTGRQFIDVLNQSIDLLLSGAMPPPPEVKPSSASPPPIPITPPPPGEPIQRFNTVRAITCIKQTMDCMGRFGTRWGYESWQQRYEHESKAILDNLEQRLHMMDETDRARRPSMWSSNGSFISSNGTAPWYSPPHATVQGPTMYQQAPPQMTANQPDYAAAGMQQQPGAPLHFQSQQTWQPGQQFFPQQEESYGQMNPSYQQLQQSSNPPSFSNPSYRPPSLPTAPSQQFAAWSGYGEASGGPDTLDEENANLQRTHTHQGSLSLVSPRASRGSMPQQTQHRPSNYVASFEPLPRSMLARPGGLHIGVDENIAPDKRRQSSQYLDPRVPAHASVPSLGSFAPVYDPSMPPPPPTPRRSSMQDASNDILRVTYPQALPQPQRVQSPRLFSPPRQRRDKGKARALDIRFPAPPAGEFVGSCRWNPSFGYVCEACSRIVTVPSEHHPNLHGSGCLDFSGSTLPSLHKVETDVMRDPERAIAIASAIRSRQQMSHGQSGMSGIQNPAHRFTGPPPQPVATGATAGFGRPGGSSSRPSFTTASQIQQWTGSDGWQSAAWQQAQMPQQHVADLGGWQQGQAPQQYGQEQSGWVAQQEQPQSGADLGYGAGAGMYF